MKRLIKKNKNVILIAVFVVFLFFNWQYNIKPLLVNADIVRAVYAVADKNRCDLAFYAMERNLSKHSIIDGYLRLKYIDISRDCIKKQPEKTAEIIQKTLPLIQENTKIIPFNTRNWYYLGIYNDLLVENKIIKKNSPEFSSAKDNAILAFEKALELSPRRPEILVEFTKSLIIMNEYQKAVEMGQRCAQTNAEMTECYWYLGVANIFVKNQKEADKNIAIAKDKGYPVDSLEKLLDQLAFAYLTIGDYKGLVEVYLKIIAIAPRSTQNYATIAYIYKKTKQYQKAIEAAKKVLELEPEAKAEVENFLSTLYQ